MKTHNSQYDDGLQYALNQAVDKIHHQNLLQQQTVHAIELEVQNLCLKVTNLKDNQSELATNTTELSKLVKVEIDLKNKLIAQLRKQLDDCVIHAKNSNPQSKRERSDDGSTVGKPAEKKFKTIDERNDLQNSMRNNERQKTHSNMGESKNESNSSKKYDIFNEYKCELLKKRQKKIAEDSQTNADNTKSSTYDEQKPKKSKEVSKTHTETVKKLPEENQSVKINNTSKNTGHCSDQVTAEKVNKVTENVHPNEKDNKLKKATCDKADKDSKSVGKLPKLQEKQAMSNPKKLSNDQALNSKLKKKEDIRLTEANDKQKNNVSESYEKSKCDFVYNDDTSSLHKLMDSLSELPQKRSNNDSKEVINRFLNNEAPEKKLTKVNNKLKNNVIKNSKKTKLIEQAAESHGKNSKSKLQKSASSLEGNLTEPGCKSGNLTKNKNSCPMVDEIPIKDCNSAKTDLSLDLSQQTSCKTNDVTSTETVVNFEECVDVMDTETAIAVDIINKMMDQEMKNIDINANGTKLVENITILNKGKIEKNEEISKKTVKHEHKAKRTDSEKSKRNSKKSTTRILRSSAKKNSASDCQDKLKKVDHTATDEQVKHADKVQQDLDSSMKVLNLEIPVLHIPETEKSVTSTELECTTAALILEKTCENWDANIELLKEDLNISSFEENDLQLFTNEVFSADCKLNSHENSLERKDVHNTSGGRKRRKVVITMVD